LAVRTSLAFVGAAGRPEGCGEALGKAPRITKGSVMGEAKRRRGSGRFSSPEEVALAIINDDDDPIAIMIAEKGALSDDEAKAAAENVLLMRARLPSHAPLMLLLDGFEDERRQPHEIPEVVRFVSEFWYATKENLSIERLSEHSSLLVFRCCAARWVAPGGTLIRLNDAGPIQWRMCDVEKPDDAGS
jgi:hypothetical protein